MQHKVSRRALHGVHRVSISGQMPRMAVHAQNRLQLFTKMDAGVPCAVLHRAEGRPRDYLRLRPEDHTC